MTTVDKARNFHQRLFLEAWGPFLEAPGNKRTRLAVLFSIKDGSFKSFENGIVKLLAKETKWASLEVRTQDTFLETLISKYDTGPVKLPGLSRNGPQVLNTRNEHIDISHVYKSLARYVFCWRSTRRIVNR